MGSCESCIGELAPKGPVAKSKPASKEIDDDIKKDESLIHQLSEKAAVVKEEFDKDVQKALFLLTGGRVKIHGDDRDVDEVAKEFNELHPDHQTHALRKALDSTHFDEVRERAKQRHERELKKEVRVLDDLKEDDGANSTITEYVVEALKQAVHDKKIRIKAVGSGWAYTSIKTPEKASSKPLTLDFTAKKYRNPDCKDLLDDIDGSFSRTLLSDDAQKKMSSRDIALVEAGCYVRDIEDYWWTPDEDDSEVPQKVYHSRHRSSLFDDAGNRYKCLANRGGYELLSLVGLASVGAMGKTNGKNVGAIQSIILSLRLLTVQDGEVRHYQIEPSPESGGLFDPAAKSKMMKLGVELIQDDQIFSDVVVSMGTFGVITHCFVKLVDASWLNLHCETVYFTQKDQSPWIEKYHEMDRRQDVYSFELEFQPYEDLHGVLAKPKCSAVFRFMTEVPDNYKPNTLKEIAKYCPLMAPDTALITPIGTIGTQTMGNIKKKFKLKGTGLMAWSVDNVSNSGFKIKEHEDPNTGKKVQSLTLSSIEALDLGPTNVVGGRVVTQGISFEKARCTEIVPKYIQFLNELADTSHLTVTMSTIMRFAKKSFGSVSCAGEEDVAWLETMCPADPLAGKESCKEAEDNAHSLFKAQWEWHRKNHKSKIHWGLWFDEHESNGKDNWFTHISDDNKRSFFKSYRRFNKDKVFANSFTRNAGMDEEEE